MFNYSIEWDGAESENLTDIIEKKIKHDIGASGSLASNMVLIRKKSSLVEALSLWMGYPGVPDSIKENPAFLTFLSVLTIALLSPAHLKLIPDSAGDVLNVFKMKGFHRIVSKVEFYKYIKDSKAASDGIDFLVERKMIEENDGNYKLLVTPLSNINISFL